MLVQSQFKQNEIICFRITTGEEIVAKLKEEDDKTYRVTKPLALVSHSHGGAGTHDVIRNKPNIVYINFFIINFNLIVRYKDN
mgnify:CR=1 FL=1